MCGELLMVVINITDIPAIWFHWAFAGQAQETAWVGTGTQWYVGTGIQVGMICGTLRRCGGGREKPAAGILLQCKGGARGIGSGVSERGGDLLAAYLVSEEFFFIHTWKKKDFLYSIFLFNIFQTHPILFYLRFLHLEFRDYIHKQFTSNLTVVVMLILVLLLYLKNRIISSASGKALCFLSCYSLSPPSLRVPTLLTHSQHQVPVLNSPVYCLVAAGIKRMEVVEEAD